MKLQNYSLAFVILLISFQISFAQEKPKALLVDEFSAEIYDRLRGRLDDFLMSIMKSPNSKGYIIIYGEKTNPFAKYENEILIKAHISLRRFLDDRIVFFHGKDEETLRTQLWQIPPDADKPDFVEENWDYKLPSTIKPFIIYKNSWIIEDGFETFSIEFYSNFLKANPNLRGHLVVYGKSVNAFRQAKEKLLKQLVNNNKVPRNQLKFFYSIGRKNDVEFWFIS